MRRYVDETMPSGALKTAETLPTVSPDNLNQRLVFRVGTATYEANVKVYGLHGKWVATATLFRYDTGVVLAPAPAPSSPSASRGERSP
jgi:hypothetical protein